MSQLLSKNITGYLEKIVGANCGVKTPLYDFDIIIGRSKTAYICSPDPNVSRNHCSLKHSSTGWMIKDLGSVNGTYINDVRIPTDTYVPLTQGCSIYFGPSDDAPEGYRFESVKLLTTDSDLPRRSSRMKLLPPTNDRAPKRKASSLTSTSKGASSSRSSADNCAEDNYQSDSSISSLDSLKTRIRKANSSQKKKEKKARICLTGDSKSGEENSLSLLNEGLFIDWDINEESKDYKRTDDEDISRSKKKSISSDLNSCSVDVQQNLLKVYQKKVDDLQKNLKTLNLKFLATMSENARLNEYSKSQEASQLRMKDDFKKLLEEELNCNICTELFIKPITLGCSHTFCQHCIFEWKKKKKQCPNCREKIESETTVLFMDNFINKAVEQLDPVSLEKRYEIMKKREDIQKKKAKGKKGKRRNRRSNNVSIERDEEVELLRSRISEIQSYTDDIQTYVDVIDELINERYSDNEIEDHVYGGYGRCYSCGRTGHWANACPY